MNIRTTRTAAVVVALLMAAGCSNHGTRTIDADDEVVVGGPSGPVIDPELDRRDINRPSIDTENWEAGGYIGALNVEDFGTKPIYGLRAAYHVTEDVFLEGEYARSEISDSSFRNLGAPLFESEDEDLTAYNLSVGYNILPGEVFVGSRWARASAMYLNFGVGNTEVVGEDNVTYLVGFGLRSLFNDWLSLRLEARDRIFESDLLGENEWKHNFEVGLTVGAFF
ncbi:MAG: outer membrane beta-barrel domain-containing protein [Chromatiales bacterium]|jgi:outer membrane beta-barrel protein|nr:outer membrane beta-barrel domain-containing protein [Chromatiales bacterium]